MEIEAIVAIDQTNAIGRKGKLPWHVPSELKHFKELTMGHAIVLGRTTYVGFKKPLPGRDHLILSSKENYSEERVFTFKTKIELFSFCERKKYSKIFICGGASIYRLFSDEITMWHISQIQLETIGADTFFDTSLYHDFKILSQQKFQDETTSLDWQYIKYQRCN